MASLLFKKDTVIIALLMCIGRVADGVYTIIRVSNEQCFYRKLLSLLSY